MSGKTIVCDWRRFDHNTYITMYVVLRKKSLQNFGAFASKFLKKSSRLSSNSEAFDSELLDNLEEKNIIAVNIMNYWLFTSPKGLIVILVVYSWHVNLENIRNSYIKVHHYRLLVCHYRMHCTWLCSLW